MRSRPILFVLALLLGWLASGASAQESLTARLQKVQQTPGFENGRWGLLVVDRDSGQVVHEQAADQLFRPASVTKLYTCAAALADLGADYRFLTVVRRNGEVDPATGTLKGDLILVASGDLSLGGRTGPDGSLLFTDSDHSYASATSTVVSIDPMAPLAGIDSLARGVLEGGIKAISGQVIIDDRLFQPAASTGSGPSRVSPIVVNDNVIDVVVAPGANPGEPASITLLPVTSYASVDARVLTVAEGEPVSLSVSAIGPRSFQVRGTIPVKHAPAVKTFEISNPADFARALFIECLRRRGVEVDASPLDDNNSASRLPSRAEVALLPPIAEYTSPPFREYLKVILKVSQNLHASTLPLLLAAKSGGSSLSEGLKREGEVLASLGIDLSQVAFGGGAGGSRSDLVTPRATVALLKAMSSRPDFATYQAALPVLGRDGTLSKAVDAESPARGHVRAKTGTYWVDNDLDGSSVMTSKALAGYMETAAGRHLIFAFFLNDVPIKEVNDATTAAGKLLGKLCEAFYDDKPAAPASAAALPAATKGAAPAVAEPAKAPAAAPAAAKPAAAPAIPASTP